MSTCRINPNSLVGQYEQYGRVSHYDSLQVQVNERLSNGLEAQGSYTYSHSLDTPIGQLISSDCAGAPGMDIGVSSNTRAYDYGPSCFDVRHNLRMSLLYHFPNLTPSNGAGSKFVDGWCMGNIVSLQTGLPFTPILANNRSNSGNLNNMPDRVDINTQAIAQGTVLTNAEGGAYLAATNFISPHGPKTAITGNSNQWFNPNMFHMQPIAATPEQRGAYVRNFGGCCTRDFARARSGDWDFSFVKDTAVPFLGEQASVEFRAEVFNILNHANFGMPASATVFNGAASVLGAYQQAPLAGVGQITTTVTTSRQIQFALKLIF